MREGLALFGRREAGEPGTRAERVALFGAEADCLYDACEFPEALLPSLRARHARVDLPDHPRWVSADDSPVRWYAAPGRLVRRDGIEDRSWIHARERTAADLETRRFTPGPNDEL
ncbi:hypothetical protein [Streptomyces sp. NPDC002078]